MKYVLSIFLILATLTSIAQQVNDECVGAINIVNVDSFCSDNGAFNNTTSSDREVWFKFTAKRFDVNITVNGNTNGSGTLGGTLTAPVVELFAACNTPVVSSGTSENNTYTLYKGGLLIGHVYYIRVTGSNNGTFQLCINNYNPVLAPGQDAPTSSSLCDTASFQQLNVTGAGINNQESLGTCLGNLPGQANEANTAWYKWIAGNNGTLVFTLTPTKPLDDIDWVLYDLGPATNPSTPNAGNAIRCSAGHGVNCPEIFYNETGLNFTSTDTSEPGGCGQGQDGMAQFITMQQGHLYALLVNNFSNGNNGFNLKFRDQQGNAGTGIFEGPKPVINFTANAPPCTPAQTFTFNGSSSVGYTSLRWYFGEGASISEISTPGPHTISYTTPGEKTALLVLTNSDGCTVVASQSFTFGLKPPPPVIADTRQVYCTGETVTLQVPRQINETYTWTGPNGFTAQGDSISFDVTGSQQTGLYSVTTTSFGCTSDPSSVTINTSATIVPVAQFRTSPTIPAKLSLPVTVTFFNDSQRADSYLWDFGDGNTSADPNPQHTYTTRGRYTVTLTATAANICNNSIDLGEFVILIGSTIFIPNTFTPNADGINDQFVVNITNLKTYKINIFNRYGELLYTGTDIFENWDGNYKGQPMPVGTYYYVINGINLDDENIKESGSITILR